jgi:hypothetical protein
MTGSLDIENIKNLINKGVQHVDIILNNRAQCSFIETNETENTIFSRPLEESLDNVSVISMNGGELVHSYITEGTSNYVVTDVTLPNGTVYNDVRFKVVTIDDDATLPPSSINLSLLGTPSSITTFDTSSLLAEDYIITSIEPEVDSNDAATLEPEFDLPEPTPVEESIDDINVHLVELLIDNRTPCRFIDSDNVENIIFCRPFSEELRDVVNINTRDKEFIHSIVTESTDRYIDTNITLPTGDILKGVRFKLVICEDTTLPYPTVNLSKYAAPVVGYSYFTPPIPENKKDDISPIEDTVVAETVTDALTKATYVKEAAIVQEKLIKQQEELKQKEAELRSMVDYFNRLVKEHKETLDGTATNTIAKLNTTVEELDLENLVDKVDGLIEERRTTVTAKQYTDKAIATAIAEMKTYTRIMMDLVGGGGSVAQQFAAGGTMNGNLNVTGQYLSGGIALSEIIASGGTPPSISTLSDTVTATENFIVFNVGGLPRAVQIWTQ